MRKKGFFIPIVLVLVSGLLYHCEAPCTRTVSQAKINAVNSTKLQEDIETIDAYLTSNAITAIEDPTGMRYTIDAQGTGSKPCIENSVTIKYKGKFLSTGVQFEASNTAVSFPLSALILGWQIVLPKIKGGSKVTLYIPSGFAYGPAGSSGGSIPGNTNLIFEIELIK